jgi:YNFM family putative membrane transporter
MPFILVLSCALFTFFVLYAPQPLLIVLATEYNVSLASSGSLMSVAMLPLAIAPICYGIVFSKFNPLRILKYAMFLLAITNIIFVNMPSFELLLATRFAQGLILPAMLTAMTTYISQQYKGQTLERNMSRYITSSIMGGYLGRVLAAYFDAFLTWQSFYYFITCMLVILAFAINTKSKNLKTVKRTQPSSPKDYIKPLKETQLFRLYCAVFCMFFCFSGLLNYLPYILQTRFHILDSKMIGWIYTSYLIGAILSLFKTTVYKFISNKWLFLSAIFVMYSLSITLLSIVNLGFFVVIFTLFCACMFMIHSTAAPLVNQLSQAPSSITNGAYVSFYYSGGALGSYLPGLIMQALGYTAFIVNLLFISLLGLILVTKNYRHGISTIRG